MTILSAQSIMARVVATKERRSYSPFDIDPFFSDKQLHNGMSYGLTAAGYDIRIGQLQQERHESSKRLLYGDTLLPGGFVLAASWEWFRIPTDIQAIVHDKSSWARQGLALQNTVLEPGWFGHITLEISNHGHDAIKLEPGMPIAQVIFHQLDQPTLRPYAGKYQNQGAAPVEALYEHPDHPRNKGDTHE